MNVEHTENCMISSYTMLERKQYETRLERFIEKWGVTECCILRSWNGTPQHARFRADVIEGDIETWHLYYVERCVHGMGKVQRFCAVEREPSHPSACRMLVLMPHLIVLFSAPNLFQWLGAPANIPRATSPSVKPLVVCYRRLGCDYKRTLTIIRHGTAEVQRGSSLVKECAALGISTSWPRSLNGRPSSWADAMSYSIND